MQLRLTDGTMTVVLSGTSPVSGATYFPQPPDADDKEASGYRQTVTETAEISLSGTASAIRTTQVAVERLLELARVRQRSGAGPRVYVEYEAVTGDSWYRSEILNGRLVWSQQPAARRLSDTTPKVMFSVIWTRRYFWEGPETQLELTSSANGTPTTGYVTVYNNDDATAAQTNWIGIAAEQVNGTLPAPLKLEIKQNDATARAWRDIYLANDVWADPTGLDPFLLGGEATGGATANWTGVSAHTTDRWVWNLSTTKLTDFAGRYWRILFAPSGAFNTQCYLKAWIKNVVGGLYSPLWEGDEVFADTDDIVLDLGAAPIPPGGYDASLGFVALTISVRAAASGTGGLDFVQVTPQGWGQYRVVRQAAYNVAQNDALVDDGIEGICYHVDAASGRHWRGLRPEGQPLMVWPNQTQRLRVLVSGTGFAPSWTFGAKAWYRPRVTTI
jgi:hypothetical protein